MISRDIMKLEFAAQNRFIFSKLQIANSATRFSSRFQIFILTFSFTRDVTHLYAYLERYSFATYVRARVYVYGIWIMYWMTDNGHPRTCGDKLDSGSSSTGNGTNLQAKGSMALELLIAII